MSNQNYSAFKSRTQNKNVSKALPALKSSGKNPGSAEETWGPYPKTYPVITATPKKVSF